MSRVRETKSGIMGVLTEKELYARQEILFEEYCKELNIEALTLIDMIAKDILPSVREYTASLAESIEVKESVLGKDVCSSDIRSLKEIMELSEKLACKTADLRAISATEPSYKTGDPVSAMFCSDIIAAMSDIREYADKLELMLSSARPAITVKPSVYFRSPASFISISTLTTVFRQPVQALSSRTILKESATPSIFVSHGYSA